MKKVITYGIYDLFHQGIVNKRFSSTRLRRRESIAMTDVMQQFTERKNFMEI